MRREEREPEAGGYLRDQHEKRDFLEVVNLYTPTLRMLTRLDEALGKYVTEVGSINTPSGIDFLENIEYRSYFFTSRFFCAIEPSLVLFGLRILEPTCI